ncbi:hypothetical protein KOR42_38030 [Thalassoglobus neptunius]|uniref:Flp pilus assembly protein RcpC/CpaB domain-containing protein n=1 Tax=Thalassoglobus neptunius TaxID=1938619 RepID=A0A5C5WIL4_9PLAN|nr:hypothetical protein KOR42_38030 [Thalassoglobus neptunius]
MKRISPAFLTMAMLGVVGLLVSMYFAKHMFAKEEFVIEDPIIEIPMALTDLAPGTLITEMHLGIGRARESSLTPETVIKDRVLLGRIVKETIPAAEPIQTNALYPPNEGPPLNVEEGMRAVTVRVEGADLGTVRLLQPGEYVDVLFTPEDVPELESTGGLIMTLFRGVKVLALDGLQRGGNHTSSRGSDVTLELTPSQANVVLLTQDKGVLNLTFNPDGKGDGVIAVSDENRATLNQILGLQEPEPPEEADKETAFVTESFSGANRRMSSFVGGRRTDQYVIEQYDYNDVNGQGSGGPIADPAGSVNSMEN